MKYIIFDLEATCWKDNRPENSTSEIIEIGAVIVNEKKEILSEFSKFIKPIINSELSDFCTELTTIKQENVNGANTFDIVIIQFSNWIYKYLDNDENFILCSWGFYDKEQLNNDLKLHGIKFNFNHISLKHQYSEIYNTTKRFGMGGALRKEGLKLDGTHHRGIDDAKNIAKIFIKLFDKWKYSF